MFSDNIASLIRQDKTTREAVDKFLDLCGIGNFESETESLDEELKQLREKGTIDGESKPTTELWKEIVAKAQFSYKVDALCKILKCQAVLDDFSPAHFDVTQKAGTSHDRNVPACRAAALAVTEDSTGNTGNFLVQYAFLATEDTDPDKIQQAITDLTERWNLTEDTDPDKIQQAITDLTERWNLMEGTISQDVVHGNEGKGDNMSGVA
ncbi:MAG: hypothetical protein SGILL_007837 [Bacillariaceae sp.]